MASKFREDLPASWPRALMSGSVTSPISSTIPAITLDILRKETKNAATVVKERPRSLVFELTPLRATAPQNGGQKRTDDSAR